MLFQKKPLTIDEQIALLANRGLIIDDIEFAKQFLSNVSYYRLRAYTYPFQENQGNDHSFHSNITFERIIELYDFDRKLRLLLLDCIERIEISIRTQIIYHGCLAQGSHWYVNPSNFRSYQTHSTFLNQLRIAIQHSEEAFIKHYREKYTIPMDPPAWMALELTSFGQLSLLYRNLNKNQIDKEMIAKHYGLNDISILENWLHSFSDVRNISAHHSRLWNRKLTTQIKFPKNPSHRYFNYTKTNPSKLYPVLCNMKYILDIISPTHTFVHKLIHIIVEHPNTDLLAMGFPSDWKQDSFWK